MTHIKTILVILCVSSGSLTALTQSNTLIFQPVNNPVLQQYNIRHINTGTDGKLWLSTDNGLLSFDGNDVKIFQHKDDDPNSLSSNDVWRTYTDPKGNLFVLNSFLEKNVNYLDVKTGRFSPVNIIHKVEDFRIMAEPVAYADLLIDGESIWLAGYFIGLAQFNMKTQKTESYYFRGEFSGKNTVYTIKKDEVDKNLLWLGTENGICSFNKITKEIKRNFRCSNVLDSTVTDLQVIKMDLLNRDTIWFAVPGKGLGCYEIKTGFYTMYPLLNNKGRKLASIDIIEMQHRNKDDYYIATENHLPGIFNTISHHYDFTSRTSQNLPGILLNNFLVDNTGNFWCVLYNRLYVARPASNKFSTIVINDTTENSQNANFFKNIIWDNKANCYYAAFEKSNEIFVIDRDFNVVKSIPLNAGKNENTQTHIYDLGLDGQGKLWVCGGNSLYVYDDVSKKLIVSAQLFPKLRFQEQQFQNFVFRSGYMYLQPSNQNYRAIYRVDLKQMDYDSISLPGEMVRDNAGIYQPGNRLDFLVMDKDGKNTYWGYNRHSFFGYIDGIIQYNLETKRAKRISHAPTIEPQNSNHIFPYALDDSDRLWIGGLNDFSVYEAGTINLKKYVAAEPAASGGPMYNAEGKNIMCRLYADGVLLYDYKNNRKYKLTLNDGLISYVNSGIAFVNNYLFVGAANYIQYISLASVIGKPNPNRKCYLSSIQLFNQTYTKDTLAQYQNVLKLPHDKNFITLTFSSAEFEQSERLEYRYRLKGVDKDWVYVSALNRAISYNDLNPGNYIFYAEVKNDNGNWSNDGAKLIINIIPAWWQTNWFMISFVLAIITMVYMFILWRIKAVRRQEQLKGKYEKEMLELESKALRAQMNPHFIFNCMNSIKSLIQQREEDKAVNYLTTFSKLIRTIFQNSDKREISLFDELETCRLYAQLEFMRFGNKFNYFFNVDETLDLKSLKVPALIIQPFIENAIWHGIMPKEDGGLVILTVERTDSGIRCSIDDDGIGREMSKRNKFKGESSSHQSKGIHLTQARLDLDNLLNERNAKVEIIDKRDGDGKSTGTIVALTFNEY